MIIEPGTYKVTVTEIKKPEYIINSGDVKIEFDNGYILTLTDFGENQWDLEKPTHLNTPGRE
jgi:hypothetical protein